MNMVANAMVLAIWVRIYVVSFLERKGGGGGVESNFDDPIRNLLVLKIYEMVLSWFHFF